MEGATSLSGAYDGSWVLRSATHVVDGALGVCAQRAGGPGDVIVHQLHQLALAQPSFSHPLPEKDIHPVYSP
jgi:hypothetical protein